MHHKFGSANEFGEGSGIVSGQASYRGARGVGGKSAERGEIIILAKSPLCIVVKTSAIIYFGNVDPLFPPPPPTHTHTKKEEEEADVAIFLGGFILF
jgi:hypothetical protein